ncbi:hypothetical protein RJT34_20010 [Clitoria ternatea]|uniref:Tr-type G domain-containing protein n=1 Tax=Clitoria ternatea TaxID=43366 RepID=A0AAN9P5A1_CLITE
MLTLPLRLTAFRVLDGVIIVLYSVGGVQSQSIVVDRQMRIYEVPRLTFINKPDRMGADPWKVLNRVDDILMEKICIHRTEKEPRGFGFVQYVDPTDAANAKHHMDDQILLGRDLLSVVLDRHTIPGLA